MGRGVMYVSVAALLMACLFSLPARAGERRAAVPSTLKGRLYIVQKVEDCCKDKADEEEEYVE